MSKATREQRQQWLKDGRCWSCGSPMKNPRSPSNYYCLRHFIRYGLRKRNLFFTKTVYNLPKNSRVRLERIVRRRAIINYLRSRYVAIRNKHVLPFSTIREALFFIDEMWSTLHLHHSFPLRTARLGKLISYLMQLDAYASGTLLQRKGWRGPSYNRKTGPRRTKCAPPSPNSSTSTADSATSIASAESVFSTPPPSSITTS